MTMRFKGTHQDKLIITYTSEGDGFQSGAPFDNGYCYQVSYMRNDSTHEKYLEQGLSPLHSRTMAFFDSLKDKHHHLGMNNLYNSTSFYRVAYHHERKVLRHGVTQNLGCGIPDSVLQ